MKKTIRNCSDWSLSLCFKVTIHNSLYSGFYFRVIVYRALAGLSPSVALEATIVYGILDSCHEVLNVRFSHEWRKRNTHAHLLAKRACGIVDFLVWIEENSCFLEQALHYDVMSFIN